MKTVKLLGIAVLIALSGHRPTISAQEGHPVTQQDLWEQQLTGESEWFREHIRERTQRAFSDPAIGTLMKQLGAVTGNIETKQCSGPKSFSAEHDYNADFVFPWRQITGDYFTSAYLMVSQNTFCDAPIQITVDSGKSVSIPSPSTVMNEVRLTLGQGDKMYIPAEIYFYADGSVSLERTSSILTEKENPQPLLNFLQKFTDSSGKIDYEKILNRPEVQGLIGEMGVNIQKGMAKITQEAVLLENNSFRKVSESESWPMHSRWMRISNSRLVAITLSPDPTKSDPRLEVRCVKRLNWNGSEENLFYGDDVDVSSEFEYSILQLRSATNNYKELRRIVEQCRVDEKRN